MPFRFWTWVGPRKHVFDGMHIGATWRIRLNHPCAAVMHPLCQITLTTCWRLFSAFDRVGWASQRAFGPWCFCRLTMMVVVCGCECREWRWYSELVLQFCSWTWMTCVVSTWKRPSRLTCLRPLNSVDMRCICHSLANRHSCLTSSKKSEPQISTLLDHWRRNDLTAGDTRGKSQIPLR